TDRAAVGRRLHRLVSRLLGAQPSTGQNLHGRLGKPLSGIYVSCTGSANSVECLPGNPNRGDAPGASPCPLDPGYRPGGPDLRYDAGYHHRKMASAKGLPGRPGPCLTSLGWARAGGENDCLAPVRVCRAWWNGRGGHAEVSSPGMATLRWIYSDPVFRRGV